MSHLCYLVLWCVVVYITEGEAANILVVVPSTAISHQIEFRPITQELVKRGHNVVVITTDPAFPNGQCPTNLTEIDVHDISYEKWRKHLTITKYGDRNHVKDQILQFLGVLLGIFEEQTKVSEVKDVIVDSSSFDLLIVEAWARYALGFSHAVKTPVLAMSSFGGFYDNFDVIGAPTHPLLYPSGMNTRLHNLSPLEKVLEYYTWFWIMHRYKNNCEELENASVRRSFGADIPPLNELQNKIGMLFLSIYHLWEDNRPVPPGVIYIAGLRHPLQKKLPEDLENYLNSSKNGVVYISFGTNVDTSQLSPEKIKVIIKAFSELPYDVIWKWNQDELPGRTENIKISKWLPQSDLLRHPKVKLFITQGGLQSTEEALSAGVPLIGIPMIADQWYNVKKYVHHKIGMHLEFNDLEVKSLKKAIKTVIADGSYRENVVRLKALMLDQPMSSLERAVWWTEHVLRHGGARHLRAPAANMPWTQYYEIELVLTVLCITLIVIVLFLLIIRKIIKVIRGLAFQYAAWRNLCHKYN